MGLSCALLVLSYVIDLFESEQVFHKHRNIETDLTTSCPDRDLSCHLSWIPTLNF